MLSAFTNSLKIPELRQRIFYTLSLLFVARVAAIVPLPGLENPSSQLGVPFKGGVMVPEVDALVIGLPTGPAGTAALARWTRSTPLLLGGLRNCPTQDCEAYGAATFSVQITL